MQLNAILDWYGTCSQLNKMTQPTLIVVGTEDALTVPANSLLLAEQIHGAWFIQMKGGGHGLMFQFPKQFAKVLLTFLDSGTD
jgi:pimeloyl-ACP methyl ester carboxylesterase